MLLYSYFIIFVVDYVTSFGLSNQENQAQTIGCSGESSGLVNIHLSAENVQYNNSSKPASYIVGTQKVNWYQAFVLCKQSNKELASITSNDEEGALETYLNTIKNQHGPYEGYWLAGRRHGSGVTDFVWFTSGKPVIHSKFALSQPDNSGGNEPCLELLLTYDNTFEWNDIDCNQKLKVICQ